jgi:hypothetical protein
MRKETISTVVLTSATRKKDGDLTDTTVLRAPIGQFLTFFFFSKLPLPFVCLFIIIKPEFNINSYRYIAKQIYLCDIFGTIYFTLPLDFTFLGALFSFFTPL